MVGDGWLDLGTLISGIRQAVSASKHELELAPEVPVPAPLVDSIHGTQMGPPQMQ